MRNTETLLQLPVRLVLRRTGDKIQDGAKAFLGQSIDDKVKPVGGENWFGDGEPGICVLRPEGWQVERGVSVVRLLIVLCRKVTNVKMCEEISLIHT
jgi:hypothetical protein